MFKINDNITAQSLYNYGFHRKCGDYKLSIPLYRYNGKPLLMLKIYADLEERTLIYKVKDLNTKTSIKTKTTQFCLQLKRLSLMKLKRYRKQVFYVLFNRQIP